MNGTSKALVNLLRGWPNPALLPVAQIKSATNVALSDPAIYTPGLLYGPDEGYEPLRRSIAAWLTNFYAPKDAIWSESICITGGASQNLACILQVYTDPIYTRNIWMVSPTYFLACRIFEDSGFHGQLRSVCEDDEGIDIQFLKEGLRKSEEKAVSRGNVKPTLKPQRPWNKIYRHVIYAVPTFSNPSSKTMSLKRRQQVVQVAREYDALIVTDDVYDQLQWPASLASTQSSLEKAVLPRIVDIDRYHNGGAERIGADGFGNAVSNGSFSKILGPGCRTGWLEGTAKFAHGLSQAGSSRSGGAPSQITATYINILIENGNLQHHIRHTLQPTYARRYRSMIAAINKHLVPLGVTLPQPSREVVGGYFIWFTLPEPFLADEVAERAKVEENLIIAPASLFAVYGDARKGELQREIRVCFSWEEEDCLAEGIERLGRVIRRMQTGVWNARENTIASSSAEDVGQFR